MEEADELYALAPEEFVASRDALAKQLRRDGHRDDAATVQALRRPSVAAWALNQVAREAPHLVTAAIEAGTDLRAASERAVAGDPSGVRAATAAERQAANEVVRSAAVHLGGRIDAQRSALLATVRVAALDPDVADQLRRGVLTTEHDQPGFGFAADRQDGAAKATPKKKRALRAVPDLEPVEDADEEAERKAGRAAAEEAKAARVAERAQRKELAGRRRTAERLGREAARLAKEAAAAEAAAEQARAAAGAAVAAAATARAAVDELGEP